MLYVSMNDFDTLYEFIGDVFPSLTVAHTRVYENHWVVKHDNGNVDFMCCAHGENCFQKKYEEV